MSEEIIKLEPRITQQNTAALKENLAEYRKVPVRVDASAVKHIGAPGFELLLAAAKGWKADGVEFSITAPSGAFMDGLGHLGLAADELGISEG